MWLRVGAWGRTACGSPHRDGRTTVGGTSALLLSASAIATACTCGLCCWEKRLGGPPRAGTRGYRDGRTNVGGASVQPLAIVAGVLAA